MRQNDLFRISAVKPSTKQSDICSGLKKVELDFFSKSQRRGCSCLDNISTATSKKRQISGQSFA